MANEIELTNTQEDYILEEKREQYYEKKGEKMLYIEINTKGKIKQISGNAKVKDIKKKGLIKASIPNEDD
jgi:hypothetical protein